MKYAIPFCLLMYVLLSNCSKKQHSDESTSEPSLESKVPTFAIEKSEIIHLLDKDEVAKAYEFLNKPSNSRSSMSGLLSDCSDERYGASKIYRKDKVIILQGKVWIRLGNLLLDGRSCADTYAVIHKKSMRVIELGGEFEETILISKKGQ